MLDLSLNDQRVPVFVITCRGCRRVVERVRRDNELVGCHERLRCTACGHRGADLIATWEWKRENVIDLTEAWPAARGSR